MAIKRIRRSRSGGEDEEEGGAHVLNFSDTHTPVAAQTSRKIQNGGRLIFFNLLWFADGEIYFAPLFNYMKRISGSYCVVSG